MNDQQRVAAAAAWQAYNAMETTKRRHFEYLTVLDNKKKNFNLEPTEDNTKLLQQLLRDHDEQVSTFTQESKVLKDSSPETHLALFKYIGELQESLSVSEVKH